MRSFSFRDLQLIPELSKYNEIELLHPDMDRTVHKYLGQLGFDLDYPIEYIASKHRDMQGNVGVGFRAVGEISTDRAFINSRLCSITERLIAASYTDPSLTKEMAKMMGTSCSFISQSKADEEDSGFPTELIEPDFEDVAAQISCLEMLKESIRGDGRNEAGALKTPREYEVSFR